MDLWVLFDYQQRFFRKEHQPTDVRNGHAMSLPASWNECSDVRLQATGFGLDSCNSARGSAEGSCEHDRAPLGSTEDAFLREVR